MVVEKFRRVGTFAPRVIGREIIDKDDFMPGRVYFHESDFTKAYGNFNKAKKHLLYILKENEDLFSMGDDYFLSIVWGNGTSKMVDFFVYSGLGIKWEANPEVSSYSTEDGIYFPEKRNIVCGDGFIILGEEEKYRRTTKNLSEYIRNPPKIEGLVNK